MLIRGRIDRDRCEGDAGLKEHPACPDRWGRTELIQRHFRLRQGVLPEILQYGEYRPHAAQVMARGISGRHD
jgi:hypothetical protein